MKTKLLLSALLGMAAWSFSGVAAANWDTGACPQPHTGPAPCIETTVGGNTYHFNGSGGHADVWHGLPGGGDFEFSSGSVDLACSLASPSCNLTLSGQVKKCQDSDGNWRIGVKVTGADVSPGDFLCNFITVGGFDWYSNALGSEDPDHCSFEDNCDNFVLYDPNASTYTANFGNITVSSPAGTLVDGEHLDGVIFTPGTGATFDFSNQTFLNCADEEQDCSIDGILTLDNATSLDVH